MRLPVRPNNIYRAVKESVDFVCAVYLKEDLGIDSLEVVDVVVLVEQEFGFKMKPEDFKALPTYGEFCNFIAEKLG